jgi:hypothetical protein
MTHPIRSSILHEGIKLTCGDRDKEYGDPKQNMTCAGELKATIRRYMARDITPAELEALDMVLTKMSRVVTGATKRDTYVDGATYFAIAGEMAIRAQLETPEPEATASEEEAPAVGQPSYQPTAEELLWRKLAAEQPKWAAE